MAGSFTTGGLITGLDTNNLIRQLIQIERQPIVRIQQRISGLETTRNAIRDLRTVLLTLRNRAQDFRILDLFNRFTAPSTDDKVLAAQVTGQNPTLGAFLVNVTQVASATVAASNGRLGAAINPGATLDSSGITQTIDPGTFTINGVTFNMDPATQSLNDVLNAINASAAGVTATYDGVADRVTFENTSAGDTSIINFGAAGDTSNFLGVISIVNATQSTGLGGSTVVTGTRNLGAVDPNDTLNTINFAAGAVSAGTFFINGVSITVNPAADSLFNVIDRINNSDAGVTVSYDANSDALRVVSDTLGSRAIRFTAGSSNFLNVVKLTTAVQTLGNDSQFTINNGPLQTRNTNAVNDAITGVTLNFASVGTATITVQADETAILEDVRAFITAFNDSVKKISELTARNGTLRGDGSIQSIESRLRADIFAQITGLGNFQGLVDIGITTGDTFDSSQISELKLNEERFLEAFRDNPKNVAALFANESGTGVADKLFSYLDEITGTFGFLNERARSNGTIDNRIKLFNNRIARLEEIVAQRERRLRTQFAQLEQVVNSFQSQGASLNNLATGFQLFSQNV